MWENSQSDTKRTQHIREKKNKKIETNTKLRKRREPSNENMINDGQDTLTQ